MAWCTINEQWCAQRWTKALDRCKARAAPVDYRPPFVATSPWLTFVACLHSTHSQGNTGASEYVVAEAAHNRGIGIIARLKRLPHSPLLVGKLPTEQQTRANQTPQISQPKCAATTMQVPHSPHTIVTARFEAIRFTNSCYR